MRVGCGNMYVSSSLSSCQKKTVSKTVKVQCKGRGGCQGGTFAEGVDLSGSNVSPNNAQAEKNLSNIFLRQQAKT